MGKISEYERSRLASSVVTPTKDTRGEDLLKVADAAGKFGDSLSRVAAEEQQRQAILAQQKAAQVKAEADTLAREFEAKNATTLVENTRRQHLAGEKAYADPSFALYTDTEAAIQKASSGITDETTRSAFVDAARKRFDSHIEQQRTWKFGVDKAKREGDAAKAFDGATFGNAPLQTPLDVGYRVRDLLGAYATHRKVLEDGGASMRTRMESSLTNIFNEYMFTDPKDIVARGEAIRNSRTLPALLSLIKDEVDPVTGKVIENYDWARAAMTAAHGSAVKKSQELVTNKDFLSTIQADFAKDVYRRDDGLHNDVVTAIADKLKPEGMPADEWVQTLTVSDTDDLIRRAATKDPELARQLVYGIIPTQAGMRKVPASVIDQNREHMQAVLLDAVNGGRDIPTSANAKSAIEQDLALLQTEVEFLEGKPSEPGKKAIPSSVAAPILAIQGKTAEDRQRRIADFYVTLRKYVAAGELSPRDYVGYAARMDGLLAASAKSAFDKGTTPLGKSMLASPEDPLQMRMVMKVAQDTARKIDAPDAVRKQKYAEIMHQLVLYQVDRRAHTQGGLKSPASEDWSWTNIIKKNAVQAALTAVETTTPLRPRAMIAAGGAAQALTDSVPMGAGYKSADADYRELESIASVVAGVGTFVDVVDPRIQKFVHPGIARVGIDEQNRWYAQTKDGRTGYLPVGVKQRPGDVVLTRNPEHAAKTAKSVFAERLKEINAFLSGRSGEDAE